ncbi:hypothetical protein GGR55DRAFT_307288 [Xylaria sp. FL0064]|nr:hypothetical protein GGR55DRAFT_307288 [Xylaria sp. FL0064]
MAHGFQLDLKTFEVSSKTFSLSLSMSSIAFIYDPQLSGLTQDNLNSLIQSKRLWLLPRGVCRLDVRLCLGECDNLRQTRDDFLEFVADTISQSSVWSQLGLSVQALDVQYHREEDNVPNLYFGIEQSDMSSALLSPPHAHTAQLKGLECILRFEPSNHLETSSKKEEQTDSQLPFSWDQLNPSTGILASHYGLEATESAELWDNAACLTRAAFCVTIGTRKGMRGLSIFELEKGPSLLDISPSIWNSQYRRSVVSHAKNFAVISNIFACSLNGQSPELRRKGAELLQKAPTGVGNNPSQHSARHLESSIQRMLWDLLQDRLKPTIGTNRTTVNNATSQEPELECQGDEINGPMVDEERFEQYEISDEDHHFYGESPPSSHQSSVYHQTNLSSNLDQSPAWQEENESIFHWDNQRLTEPKLYDAMERSCSEIDISGYQLPGPYNQYMTSDLPNAMQDTLMSDCMYDENDDIYDCKFDCVALARKGLEDYDPIATRMPYWEARVAASGN